MRDSASASLPLPAVLFCDSGTAGLRVVSLTLLDRLIVAAHRAGCAPLIVVSTGDLPDHRRSQALGIPVEHARLAPRIAGPALVASTRQWVVAADLAQLRRFGGRLISTGGSLLPSGVVRELLPPTPSGAARGPLNRRSLSRSRPRWIGTA